MDRRLPQWGQPLVQKGEPGLEDSHGAQHFGIGVAQAVLGPIAVAGLQHGSKSRFWNAFRVMPDGLFGWQLMIKGRGCECCAAAFYEFS